MGGFWSWLDNSNVGGAIIGLIFWAAPVTAWLHWQHRKDRAHSTELHQAIHRRLNRIERKGAGTSE